jgi:hypothetical protein
VRRRSIKSVVKYGSLTVRVPLILMDLSEVEVGGIDGVAVKCLDIVKNTDSEDSLLGLY